jgi:hypothetical protein
MYLVTLYPFELLLYFNTIDSFDPNKHPKEFPLNLLT